MARKTKAVEPAKGVFLRGGKWWCRVRAPGREPTRRSLGADADQVPLANDRFAMLDTLTQQRQFDLLEAVIDGTLEIAELHADFLGNRLEESRKTATDANVEPQVAKWEREMARMQSPSASTRAEYVRQVRTLIGEGKPYMRSAVTVEAGNQWLGDLGERGYTTSTMRRHGVALVQFVKFLRVQKLVDTTTMAEFREWQLPANNPPRQVWWDWRQTEKCLTKMPAGEPGSLERQARLATLLVFGTGMEVSAVLNGRGGDVTPRLRTVWANGDKNKAGTNYRSRNVQVRKWAWSEFYEYAREIEHTAALFPDLKPDRWREMFYNAQAEAGLCTRELVRSEAGNHYYVWPDAHTLHDGRHTFCYLVMTGEDGERKQGLHYCKTQLGHRDLQMVQRIYANFNLPAEALVEESEVVPQLVKVSA